MEIATKKTKLEIEGGSANFFVIMRKVMMNIRNGNNFFSEPLLLGFDKYLSKMKYNQAEIERLVQNIFEIIDGEYRFPLMNYEDKNLTLCVAVIYKIIKSHADDKIIYTQKKFQTLRFLDVVKEYNDNRILIETFNDQFIFYHNHCTTSMSSSICDFFTCTCSLWMFGKTYLLSKSSYECDHICFRFFHLVKMMVDNGIIGSNFYLQQAYAFKLFDGSIPLLKETPNEYFDQVVKFAKSGYLPAITMAKHIFAPEMRYDLKRNCLKAKISNEDWVYIHIKSQMLGHPTGIPNYLTTDWRWEECVGNVTEILEKENPRPPLDMLEAWKFSFEIEKVFNLLLCELDLNEKSLFYKFEISLDIFKAIVRVSGLFFLDPKF